MLIIRSSCLLCSRQEPDFEAPILLMAYLTASQAFHDMGLYALIRLMANLVALETEFGVALKWVMGAFAAEDAVRTGPLIRALFSHVAELLAITALDCRIWLYVVPSHLILEFWEHVLQIILVINAVIVCNNNDVGSSLVFAFFLILIDGGLNNIAILIISITMIALQ